MSIIIKFNNNDYQENDETSMKIDNKYFQITKRKTLTIFLWLKNVWSKMRIFDDEVLMLKHWDFPNGQRYECNDVKIIVRFFYCIFYCNNVKRKWCWETSKYEYSGKNTFIV